MQDNDSTYSGQLGVARTAKGPFAFCCDVPEFFALFGLGPIGAKIQSWSHSVFPMESFARRDLSYPQKPPSTVRAESNRGGHEKERGEGSTISHSLLLCLPSLFSPLIRSIVRKGTSFLYPSSSSPLLVLILKSEKV